MADNVDYDDIKRLIKDNTTNTSEAYPIAIPGQGTGEVPLNLEQHLYSLLYEEHDRVNLFFKSKAGEIKRRLEHIGRQTTQLDKQRRDRPIQKRMSVRRVEKYSQLEGNVLKVGEELQSLSTFAGAQRIAFFKLLKKYRKWTGSSRLESRLRNDVFQKSDCLTQDFGLLLSQYTKVLAAVRAPFDAGATWKSIREEKLLNIALKSHIGDQATPKIPNAAAELHKAFQTGSGTEADYAFSTLPLGDIKSGHAVYWAHSDNFVQLCILLQHYMRVRDEPCDQSRGHILETGNGHDIGVVVCDNLKSFTQRQSAQPNDGQTRSGLLRAAASIRYASTDAIASVGYRIPKKAKFKRKSLGRLFGVDSDPSLATRDLLRHDGTEDMEKVQDWLHTHPEVQPLVQVTCKRTRFIGLTNSSTQGIWAALDHEAFFSTLTVKDLGAIGNKDGPLETDTAFPHTVLAVRWEGQGTPELVKTLNDSHLVKHVPGFSLEVHAVAKLFRKDAGADMPMPFWLSTLEKDIRQAPSRAPSFQRRSRRSSTMELGPKINSASTASATDGPSSGFSAAPDSPATSVPDELQASSLKAFRKKDKTRTSKPNHPLRHQSTTSQRHPKYWNEFDDGDEVASNEVYTILVDPNEPSALSRFLGWLRPSRTSPSIDPERQSLLADDYFTPGHTDHSSGNSSTMHSPTRSSNTSLQNPRGRLRGYSTFSSHHGIPHPKTPTTPRRGSASSIYRHKLLVIITSVSFVTSFILSVMAGVLVGTRRHRYVATADVGALIGVMASVLFAILGLAVSFAKGKDLGWLGRVTAVVAFALACTADGIMVVVMVGE